MVDQRIIGMDLDPQKVWMFVNADGCDAANFHQVRPVSVDAGGEQEFDSVVEVFRHVGLGGLTIPL